MPTQKSTQSTAHTLAPQQSIVICAIAQGATVSDATRQAGVDRTTFYLWMKDPEFEAELNGAKQEHSDYTRALLRGLADTAVNNGSRGFDGAECAPRHEKRKRFRPQAR